MRKSSNEHNYSEYIHKAGEVFDSLREVETKRQQLEKEYKAVMQQRSRTNNPEELNRLSQEIAKLRQKILFYEEEKSRLAAQVREYTEKHMKGSMLLDQADTKHIN